jgi:hypothetical protein
MYPPGMFLFCVNTIASLIQSHHNGFAEGINQLPLRARIALTPLQLTSYLGSRQPPVPPPSVPIEHEKIDFISVRHDED